MKTLLGTSFPAARRAISSRSIESCTDVSSPPASSDRAGGFGGFKKKVRPRQREKTNEGGLTPTKTQGMRPLLLWRK